jgi:uncharacterized membrane protein
MSVLDERGQTTILVVGLTLVVFAVAGLAVDGTRAFLFRRTLQNIADASVVAAAGEINETSYYVSGGRELQLDPARADRTARQWLAQRGIPLGFNVQVDPNGVTVTARGELKSTFLSLVGIDRIPVSVEASARPIGGSAPRR